MALDQKAYRFYEDGTESGSTAVAAQSTAISRELGGGDSDLAVRIMVEATGFPIDADPDPDWPLQYRVNGGSWVNVTGASAGVKGFASTNLSNGGATTNRLTGGTGSFVAGKISEDGVAEASDPVGGQYTEFLYSITLVAADLDGSDVLEFRVLTGVAALDTYTVYPSITVSKTGGGGGSTAGLLLMGVG